MVLPTVHTGSKEGVEINQVIYIKGTYGERDGGGEEQKGKDEGVKRLKEMKRRI